MHVQHLMKSSVALAPVAFLELKSKPSADKEEHTESPFQLYLLWMQIICGLTSDQIRLLDVVSGANKPGGCLGQSYPTYPPALPTVKEDSSKAIKTFIRGIR